MKARIIKEMLRIRKLILTSEARKTSSLAGFPIKQNGAEHYTDGYQQRDRMSGKVRANLP